MEFNISHSGNLVVCAVSDMPVGIDIEEIRPINLNIAKHICTENDLNYLFGHVPLEEDFTRTEGRNMLIRFFQIWTAKEAYFKCVGTGITDLKSIDYSSVCKEPLFLQVVQETVVVSVVEGFMRESLSQ